MKREKAAIYRACLALSGEPFWAYITSYALVTVHVDDIMITVYVVYVCINYTHIRTRRSSRLK